MAIETVPTMKIRDKKGVEFTINVEDFDIAMHKLADKKATTKVTDAEIEPVESEIKAV